MLLSLASSVLALSSAAYFQPPPLRAPLRVGSPPRAALYERRDVALHDEWEGLITKITDYGFFAKLGHEGHLGLVHVKTLTPERLPRDEVEDWIEEQVGPVGSKVRVEVISLEYRGKKQIALNLLDVITQQHMEDLVFAPGPRRMQNFDEQDAE